MRTEQVITVMQSRSKLILVGIVLLSGIAGALSFRHQHPAAATKPATGLERRSREISDSDGEGHLLGTLSHWGRPRANERPDAAVSPVPAR